MHVPSAPPGPAQRSISYIEGSSAAATTGYSHASLYVTPTAPSISELYPPVGHSFYAVSLPCLSGGASGSGSVQLADTGGTETEPLPPSYDKLYPM